MGFVLIVFLFTLINFLPQINGFDPLDPNGNITIRWDIVDVYDDTSLLVKVNIINNQLYRHIELPGWKLSFIWPGKEVIMTMHGAETTEQGNCSAYKGREKPHCCKRKPEIIDLLSGAPYNKQAANCCKGGVLSTINQAPDKYGAGFQMTLAGLNISKGIRMPKNFSLGIRGYSCQAPSKVPSTKFYEDHGRRFTNAYATYNITCTYSQFVASRAPRCCVSLSAFYNETIIPCSRCSCACQGLPGTKCVGDGESRPILQLPNERDSQMLVQCTQHMCPIKVHWHIKQSYKEFWRVRITVTNFNFAKNYSQWNLVVLHPNLGNLTQVFSFNYKPLDRYPPINDTAMFYGIKFYNDMLLQSGEYGNVQTEILLHKESGFSFRNGWAFPRKIIFNGDYCVMPPPDEFPTLPNTAYLNKPSTLFILLFTLYIYYAIF